MRTIGTAQQSIWSAPTVLFATAAFLVEWLDIALIDHARALVLISVVAISTATLLAAPGAASASPAVKQSALPVSQDTSSASSQQAAIEIAEEYQHAVVVDSDTTTTSQVSAMPDGTMQLVTQSVPVRVKTAGGWTAVDTTLTQSADGFWAPRATDNPVEFAAGGSEILAKVQTAGGKWVEEGSPFGVLPKPVIKSSIATYSEVLPGVDLQLAASAQGMREVLVIKTASAAANPALTAVAFPVSGGQLIKTDGGVTTATTSDGASIDSASPMWWDSSDGSDASGPAGDNSVTPVVSSTNDSSLTLDASGSALGRAAKYPIYVDPDWTGSVQHFTYVDAAYPTQSYYDGNAATGQQRVGYVDAANSPDGRAHTARALWQLDTSGVEGKTITAAQFSVTEDWSFNCTASPVELWQTRGFNSATTWNNPPLAWVTQQDTQTVAHGYSSSCPTSAVGFSALSAVTTAASGSQPTITLGLKATNESSNSSWKRFNQSASLTITYDSKPNTPSAQVISSPSRACGTSTAPVFVNNTQALTLQASITDPDPGNVQATFKVWVPGAAASTYSVTTAMQAQGNQSWSVPANGLVDGQLYYWTVRGSDGIITSNLSIQCYFQVDNTGPALPTVTPQTSPTRVGSPFTVQFSSAPSDHVATFAYWWTDGTPTSPSPPAPSPLVGIGTAANSFPADGAATGGVRYASPLGTTGTAAAISVAPIDTSSTLYVASFDLAGNESAAGSAHSTGTGWSTVLPSSTVDYVNGHQWVVDQLPYLTSPVADSNTTTGSLPTSESDLVLGSGTVTTSTDTLYDEIDETPVFDFSSGSPTIVSSTRQVVDTTKSFTVSAWLNPLTLLSTGHLATAVSQAGTTNSGFALQLNASGQWQFCVTAQISGASSACATSGSTTATIGTWVLVTGIWDVTNQQVRLLLGNSLTAAGVHVHHLAVGDVSAAGDALIGSDFTSGASSNPWNGEIDDPGIYPGVIDSAQLLNLASFLPIN